MNRGRDMEDVGKAMTLSDGVCGTEAFGGLVHIGPVDRTQFEDAICKIGLQIL